MYRFLWENRSSFLCDAVLCLVTLLCLTLCDAMHCSPPGSSVPGNSPGKNIGVGCHALLQGIFTIQGSNPGLSHCGQILYHLSRRGSPRILDPPVLRPHSRTGQLVPALTLCPFLPSLGGVTLCLSQGPPHSGESAPWSCHGSVVPI